MIPLSNSPRRHLSFNELSDIQAEVARLSSKHRTIRNWSLGQICRHLAQSFDGSIDGLDLSRHRIKRMIFRRALLFYTLRWGIPEQYRVDPGIEPAIAVTDEVGIEELRQAIQRYQMHSGPLKAHPLFGKMGRQTWDRIHCIHCAHHLSFVWPRGEDDATKK